MEKLPAIDFGRENRRGLNIQPQGNCFGTGKEGWSRAASKVSPIPNLNRKTSTYFSEQQPEAGLTEDYEFSDESPWFPFFGVSNSKKIAVVPPLPQSPNALQRRRKLREPGNSLLPRQMCGTPPIEKMSPRRQRNEKAGRMFPTRPDFTGNISPDAIQEQEGRLSVLSTSSVPDHPQNSQNISSSTSVFVHGRISPNEIQQRIISSTPSFQESLESSRSTTSNIDIRIGSNQNTKKITPEVHVGHCSTIIKPLSAEEFVSEEYSEKIEFYRQFKKISSQRNQFNNKEDFENTSKMCPLYSDSENENEDDALAFQSIHSQTTNLAALPKLKCASPRSKTSASLQNFSPRSCLFLLESNLAPRANFMMQSLHPHRIDLSHQGIGDEFGLVLAQCLNDVPHVQYINLADNRLTDKSLVPILQRLGTDLLFLNLSQNKIDEEASSMLRCYLGNTNCRVTSLILSHADVDDDECSILVETLAQNKNLTCLDLSHNLIGKNEAKNVVSPTYTTGAEAIADYLTHDDCTLKTLDLSWNFIRLESSVAIGKSLSKNTVLTDFNLAYNTFGKDGGEALGKSLYQNQTLKVLDISYNSITPQAAFVIAVSLRLNPSLEHLNLNGNSVGECGGRALMALACTTSHQIEISLKDCNFKYNDETCWFEKEFTQSTCLVKQGTYSLDMNEPYEFAVLGEILRLATFQEGFCISSLVSLNPQGEKTNIQLVQVCTENNALKELLHGDSMKILEMVDENHSGVIVFQKLCDMFQQLQLNATEKELEHLMLFYDRDQSGAISCQEFLELFNVLKTVAIEKSQEKRFMATEQNPSLEWKLPSDTKVEVAIKHEYHVADEFYSFQAHHLHNVFTLCEGVGNEGKLLELAFELGHIKLHQFEAQQLFEKLSIEYGCKTKAMQAILPNMATPLHARLMLISNIKKGNCSLSFMTRKMGVLLSVLVGITTGRFKLDLSNKFDRTALKKFLELNNFERNRNMSSGCFDTSQEGNWDNFRNVYFNSVKMPVFPHELMQYPLSSGILQFDYVTTTRPTTEATVISNKQLCMNMKRLGLVDQREVDICEELQTFEELGCETIGLTRIKRTQKFYASLRAEYGEQDAICSSTDESTSIPLSMTPSRRVSNNTAPTLPGFLIQIQLNLMDYWFSCKQVRSLLLEFGVPLSQRKNLAISLFSRVVDLRNFNVVLEVFSEEDQAYIVAILGMLNTWNPMNPDGFIELDLSRREERQIGKMLVHLAKIEPGENILNPTFQRSGREGRVPGWVLPDTWCSEANFPSAGIVSFEYYSGEGKGLQGCSPVYELRAALASTVVLCELDPEVREKYSHVQMNRSNVDFWLNKGNLNIDYGKNATKLTTDISISL